MIRKSLLWTLLLAGLYSTRVDAQTITAASCSASDVQTAINTAISAGDTTVVIPSGTCTWTTQVTAAPKRTFTIQGQTTCTGSGDPASNDLSCTDGTTITDSVSGNAPALMVIPSATGLFRLTGITIGSSVQVYHGTVQINGNATNPGVRVDHCHFIGAATGDLEFDGWIYGVVDHNVFYATNDDENEVRIYNGMGWNGSTDEFGHASWNDSPYFGSNKFIFLEQNYFYSTSSAIYQLVDDCATGGRFVARFNTIGYHMIPYTHGTTGGGGAYRGCRALEIYDNVATWNSGNSSDQNYTFLQMESGTGLVWGNIINGQNSILNEANSRSGIASYGQTAPPNGWGEPGTLNGGPSAWDGNSTPSTGYPALDMPGRGKGDLLQGNFPTLCNATAGCSTSNGVWPHQAVEPYYAWANTANSALKNYWGNTDVAPLMQENRDYYLQLPNKGEPASFNGTAGIGQGTLASKPSTCTPGVGWWATDQGSWNQSGNGAANGAFYVCTATNTWTLFYTPYVYPHPLSQGTGPVPAAPTNLHIVP